MDNNRQETIEQEHIHDLIERLRNASPDRSENLLKEAADTIERLYAELHDERIMRQVLAQNLHERLNGGGW